MRVYFATQDPDEKIILFLRRHPITFLGNILRLVLVSSAIPIILYVINRFYPEIKGETFYVLIILTLCLYFLYNLLFFLIAFIDYYLDVWLVTDRRIVNIEQKALFNRTMAELRIFRIQDVTYETKGLLQTFLKYGNVYIQTAGIKERFIFKQVPNPEKVQRIIIDLHDGICEHSIEAMHAEEEK